VVFKPQWTSREAFIENRHPWLASAEIGCRRSFEGLLDSFGILKFCKDADVH
jgi:hypothetical protein